MYVWIDIEGIQTSNLEREDFPDLKRSGCVCMCRYVCVVLLKGCRSRTRGTREGRIEEERRFDAYVYGAAALFFFSLFSSSSQIKCDIIVF